MSKNSSTFVGFFDKTTKKYNDMMIQKYRNTLPFRAIVLALVWMLFPIKGFPGFSPQSGYIDPEQIGGWMPTDAGLVVKLNEHDRFRLSTVIGGTEYFVCDYYGYTGGTFKYATGDFLKLVPRNDDGTPPDGSLWTIGKPLQHVTSDNTKYDLVTGMDGIVYTMWSVVGEGEVSKTLATNKGSDYILKDGGYLTDKEKSSVGYLCNVAFAIPTVRSRANMDPQNKMGRGYPFDGQMGVDEKGEVWREVYWFHKSRRNSPYSYASFGLTAFNTGNGKAYQINGKTSGQNLMRMLFRLYIVKDNPFVTCPDSYFFAQDEQNYLKFVKFTALPITSTDSTTARKIYTHDLFHRMTRIGTTTYYQTEPYIIPQTDSAYFYVGKNNEFYSSVKGESLGSSTDPKSLSAFTKIGQLRIRHLADKTTASGDPFIAPKGACGRIVVDTTSGSNNLGATFDPVGYFFRTSSGVNVPMTQVDDSTWITSVMWHIADDYMRLKGIVLLYSGTTFSSTDQGVKIAGWSDSIAATDIPVYGHSGWTAKNQSGWARIHTNRSTLNGGIEFVLANTGGNYIEYSNNGHFGVELPRLYPLEGETTVKVQAPQLLQGYEFYGWNTAPDTTQGTLISVGTVINFNSLPSGVSVDENGALKLYAKAKYTGSINVAISFLKDDERYFLSLPTSGATYARARHYDDWTDTWQGMGNESSDEADYLATFKLIGKETETECVECTPGEYVWDPHRSVMHGSEDSLVFYENNQLSAESYIGLYYDAAINTVLYNNNWAGLFQSSRGWPTPAKACVDSTRLFSTHYLFGWPASVRTPRNLPSNIKYNATDNQFDGVGDGDSTIFTLSGVGVVDAHYIVLPDTTDAATSWTEAITFGFHQEPLPQADVYSKLIGKQLLAQMKVGKDTIYFHPNRNKILTTANALALSSDFRLTHKFEYIRDARVEALHLVAEADKTTVSGTDDASFHCTVTSGESSPIGVQLPGGEYIDIIDTLRVWLQPGRASRIKEYFGRWNAESEGVHLLSDGSRYRDILVTTKTYHYGPAQQTLRLVPAQESYNFGSLQGAYQDLNFTLELITWKQLYDVDNNPIRIDTFSIADTTSILNLTSATFNLERNDVFTKGTPTTLGIRLTTQRENFTAPDRDTLTVSTTVSLGGTPTPVTVQVPLLQVSTIGNELIWSVKYGDARYFIMGAVYDAGIADKRTDVNNLRIQTFDIRNSRLVRNGSELILGSFESDGKNNRQHIRPWKWTDVTSNSLTLKTEYGINKYFHIKDETTPEANETYPSTLTFEIVATYTNSNGNYEEIVRLQYGSSQWLRFNGTTLELVNDTTGTGESTQFSWAYMKPEYNLLNNGTYPSKAQEEFAYNTSREGNIQTRYKAYLDHSMLLNNQLVHVCKTEETDIKNLINPSLEWKTLFTDSIIPDRRVLRTSAGIPVSSGLSISRIDTATLTTYIAQTGTSPLDVKDGLGQNTNIVDTLDFRITLQPTAPEYRFAGNWSAYASVENAHLKIPLIRHTYHEETYDSITCSVDGDEYNYAFPAVLREGVREDSVHTIYLSTYRNKGTKVYDVNKKLVTTNKELTADSTSAMDLTNIAMSEVRLKDEFGNKPTWCDIIAKGKNSITVKCYSNGIRSPRVAYIELVYIILVDGKMRFVNYRFTVSQASYFQYENNQTLFHTAGASGDPVIPNDGRQYAHENTRILYYYNPIPYAEADQEVELPLRERGFYGWWRWYREGNDQNGKDVSDTDIPDSVWIVPPHNVDANGTKYNFPYRTIGDSVKILNPKKGQKGEPDSIKVLATMGRYTVFHYPAGGYSNKWDPAAKTPRVKPPFNKDTVTYVVDISNYYDNLPLSTKSGQKNQIDTARLEATDTIYEPTLSLREIFELHPWTEMAERLENYKDTIEEGHVENTRYMEDHVVMAPTGARLLLSTEQRYVYEHLAVQTFANGTIKREGHSESLLGYYMRDDNWATGGWSANRKDTMIWCGGWDATCAWYTYNPSTHTYDSCPHPITVDDDFLEVPIKGGITPGKDFDTVYYCLRARSKKTTTAGTVGAPDPDEPEDGDYWFNICRYTIIYHNPNQYGPKEETNIGGVMRALKTNKEIEESYEILEQLNFDYNQPGSDYIIYPHPLPWKDGSYGYTYPLSSSALPNRYHKQTDFPGPGEYALINKIPRKEYWGETFWRPFEQHGGAENGYMIYCDGMSSSGQVAALSLQTVLCEGQRLYFSGYVGNVSSQKGKANPNFTFSVQGSLDGNTWEDVTSYMTGDVQPSDNWYQIFFPILFTKAYTYFRVRIYNMASSFDGNDFVLDDMCLFATKPPLVAYQANTKCVEKNETDSIIHVVLRVDYQGFVDENFYGAHVHYTVDELSLPDEKTRFVPMMDGYMNEGTKPGADASKPDTIYGWIPMPAKDYTPSVNDSIFVNLNQLANRFEESYEAHEAWEKLDAAARETIPEPALFREGFIYEYLDGNVRPVLYVVHKAKMIPTNKYTVRMALNPEGLMSSQCAVTSNLNVTSRMKLVLNGEEREDKEVADLCGDVTHDISLRVRGTLIEDGTAPMDLAGSCVNDWLLYGDTAEESSLKRYGYRYSDIVKVVKDVLRAESSAGVTNRNQFARSLGGVNRSIMQRVQTANEVTLTGGVSAYNVLKDLVNKGYLLLYQSHLPVTVGYGDSVQYVIFPILGTGTDEMHKQKMDVCPNPIVVKLKSKTTDPGAPMLIGGLHRDSTQSNNPVVVLADALALASGVKIPVDSIKTSIGVRSVSLLSTDDPNYRSAVHRLAMTPDKPWPIDVIENYYHKGDTMYLTLAASNNYTMQPGYNYTFNMEMSTALGTTTGDNGCPIGDVMFTISYVPDYLRWSPRDSLHNKWNDPDNWIGIDAQNRAIHDEARFAPLPTTKVVIPAMTDGMPYPVLKAIESADSIQEVGFAYNTCDAIRFLPGAAMGQQQYLSYNDAVIDMTIPNQKWALRATPVTGLVSGDIYMSNADLVYESNPWEVASFDANGRTYTTGNASFWLSLYNTSTVHVGGDDGDRTAAAEWSKVTNGMDLSLPPAQGWAVYTHTRSSEAADIRLPKNDDIYYYYDRNGQLIDYLYVDNIRATRTTNASPGTAGQMAFQPSGGNTYQDFTLTNGVASTSFVFGNPTMGYIDIWGFIADNSLTEEISYLNASGTYTTVTSETTGADTIINPARYLPPMHAMVINTSSATEKVVRLNTNRILTAASQKERPLPAPAEAPSRFVNANANAKAKGIMTITAVNPVSNRCVSRLLIGQGYHDAILSGEDAVLTTLNIDRFSMTNTPTTPFNLYASEGNYGLSIDLRDSIVYVPLSFYMSNLPYDSVTYLWFTGVNGIEGPLVLYDALLGTERLIIDGICLDIETPEQSHELRYFIRRPGYTPENQSDDNPVTTGSSLTTNNQQPMTYKILRNGHVYIIRDGHVFTVFGQQIR